ncbi:MAG TPA: triose-phosphate isomerase [Clostridiaceae bacterium]|nr:triose-phosphate isomerase [Clostridiaceae bacterium]
MKNDLIIKPPFFEIGPKSYLYGDDIIELAEIADRASIEFDVQVIFTCPFVNIQKVVERTSNLLVTAPHMDPILPGRGLADILPESLKAVGVSGVMLNHVEKPLRYSVLEATIKRAKEVGLFTVVCASSIPEIQAVAHLAPDIIVAEPTELIGTGQTSDLSYMKKSLEVIHAINPDILVLQAAGISDGNDVFRVMEYGADATGSSSAIANAEDKEAIVRDMISAVRRGWESRINK